tara:strand:+ start:4420 stop:4770 length:351 start_codon:yes stop_codon:yes gene_type:complete
LAATTTVSTGQCREHRLQAQVLLPLQIDHSLVLRLDGSDRLQEVLVGLIGSRSLVGYSSKTIEHCVQVREQSTERSVPSPLVIERGNLRLRLVEVILLPSIVCTHGIFLSCVLYQY